MDARPRSRSTISAQTREFRVSSPSSALQTWYSTYCTALCSAVHWVQVMVEGILVFYFSRLREMFDLKLFVDTDPDTRLARRVLRDISERGRDLENVLHQVQQHTVS